MNKLEKAHYSRHLTSADKCSERDLQHWKYIKREKVNGKWRYYYNEDSSKKKGLKEVVKDKLGYDEKERWEEADNKVMKEHSDANRALDSYHGYQQYLGDKYYRSPFIDPYTGKLKEAAQKAYDEEAEKLKELKAILDKEDKEAQQSGYDYHKALDEFYKTPLGKLEQAKNTIQAGKKAVTNLLEKLESKKSSTRYRLFKKK